MKNFALPLQKKKKITAPLPDFSGRIPILRNTIFLFSFFLHRTQP